MRQALLHNSRTWSQAAREAAKANRFTTKWSKTLHGAGIVIEGADMVARQTGKYPTGDGTSVWSDAVLPSTGVHYWECVFRCSAPVEAQPPPAKGSALRGGFLIGVAKSTVTELDEDDKEIEVDRDCASEQYIFRLPGSWGLEDSANTNGGPLRCDGCATSRPSVRLYR